MPKLTARLSTESLDALLESLKAYKKKIEEAPAKLVSELADYGEQQIQRNIDGIADKDGN